MTLQSSSARWLHALVLLAFFGPTAARGDTLGDMLRAAEEQARPGTTLRADIEAVIEGVDGTRQEHIVLLVRPQNGGKDIETFLELRSSKARYLILADGSAHRSEGGATKPIGLDAPIGATNWTIEDLLPFTAQRCGVKRLIDVMPRQITVLCNPEADHPGQYVLWVYKFDRDNGSPVRVMYYQERQDNLVKMLRNEELVEVGGKWRPAKMVMQNFPLRTRDVFTAKWSGMPDAPAALFDPKSFADAPLGEASVSAQ